MNQIRHWIMLAEAMPLDKNGNALVYMDNTPIPMNPDGTVTLYHRTSEEAAEQIKRTGRFVSKENRNEVYFSNKPDGQAESFGDYVVEVRIRPNQTRYTDVFRHEIYVAVSVRSLSSRNITGIYAAPDETTLQEARRETPNIYAHVSPGKNLRAILKQGLVPNANQGNYSANYWEALEGVYVTRDLNVLRQHVRARDMTDDYLIVLVQVGGQTFIDEDTIDDMLQAAFDSVMRKHGLADDDVDEIEEVTPEIVTAFSTALGEPDPTVLAENPDIITEFVDGWIVERIYGGEGPDTDWWPYAKELLVRAFKHIPEGHALRIPQTIGYTGATRIVGIVRVTHGQAKVVKGTVPSSASELVAL